MSTEGDVAKGAGTAIGVAAAACSVVPGIGTAVCGLGAAIASAFVAIGEAFASSGRESFAVTPGEARAFLALWNISPGLAFTGLDKIVRPDEAAVLARIFRAKAGYVPGLDLKDGAAVNAYLSRPDPREPLTDPAYLTPLAAKFHAYSGDGHDWADRGVPPEIHTPEAARSALALLRAHPDDAKFAILSHHSADSPSFRSSLIRVREIAGESGAHDPVLEPFIGDLSFTPKPHPRRDPPKPAPTVTARPAQAAPKSSSPSPQPTHRPIPAVNVGPLIVAGAATAVFLAGLAWILSNPPKVS